VAKKLRVGVIFGGRSGEHEVSIRSARAIVEAIDRRKFEVVPIGITEEGKWLRRRSRTTSSGCSSLVAAFEDSHSTATSHCSAILHAKV
jgi:D-alanine-D-alanine ligase-like ATP-grasp enzyme